MTRPRVLIEDWLPIEIVGAESLRDASAARKPPLNRLHVWWARRPLTVSRAAILGSVLPGWSPDWPTNLLDRFPSEQAYRKWYVYLIGVRGDPVAGRKLINSAKARGAQLESNPYGSAPRAFTINPAPDDLALLGDLLEHTWGTRDLSVLDPFAGGGSIPFEALRYGFTTFANDLNPVAAVILKATLEYPARFGPELADDIRKWGTVWAQRVKAQLEPYFPKEPGESIFAYLWARTVACPTTGKPVPLSPNWWLRREGVPVAVQLITDPHQTEPEFRIVRGDAVKLIDPDAGTMSRGNARSPWTGEVIDGDYIKAEAQAGRMGEVLYAVAVKTPQGVTIRAATQSDLAAVALAKSTLQSSWLTLQTKALVPDESIPYGHRAHERDVIVLYGVLKWSDMFSPRQLLANSVLLSELHQIRAAMRDSGLPKERTAAIATYLAIMLDKCVNYNSNFASWNAPRSVMRSVFDRHDFSFKWTFGEFDASANLLPWAVEQVVDAVQGIANLVAPKQRQLEAQDLPIVAGGVQLMLGSASNLKGLSDRSIHNITVDPPYYNNVDYAELSDFFYVWMKRSLHDVFPATFEDPLTNKDDESIANPARFHDGRRSMQQKKKLAEQDYERKMAAAFREMHRVLHDDGVLTVMFTHKRVEAWDTLAAALIGAGFTIHASWPVHTESEHSLHQAQKNAAASTILLVCRKRVLDAAKGDDEAVWWDDIKERVRRTAREKAQAYVAQGITGVDLYISTFGPTLSVISEQWPVLTSEIDPRTGQPIPLRPEIALDLAREEVVRLRKEGLLAGRAITFDAVTDWYLMAWDAFQAEEFPFDEARKLAIALGLEMSDLMTGKRLVAKKGEYVVLQRPIQRRKKGMVDPDATSFEHLIDAAHTAMLIYGEDGAGACDVFLQNRGLKRDSTFKACLQALINAIPRTRVKGKFVRSEADLLDRMRLAFYADELTVPAEEEPALPIAQQGGLFEQNGESALADEEGEEEEE